jgi:hypothetical protein
MKIIQNIDRDDDGNMRVRFEFEMYSLEIEDSFLAQSVKVKVPEQRFKEFTVTVNGQEYVTKT